MRTPFIAIAFVASTCFAFLCNASPLDEFDLPAFETLPSRIVWSQIECGGASNGWMSGQEAEVEVPPVGGATFPGAAPLKAEGMLVKRRVLELDGSQPLEMRIYSGGGELLSSIRYDHDASGNLIAKIRRGSDGGIEREERFKYENGHRSYWAIYVNGILIEEHDYVYHEDGRLKTEMRRFTRPPRVERIEYSYEAENRRVSIEHFNEDGSLDVRHIRFYDESDRFIGETYFDKGGNQSGSLLIDRDEEGYITRKRIMTPRSGEEYVGLYRNNGQGHPVELEEYNRDGDRLTHDFVEYRYHDSGPWSLRVKYTRQYINSRAVYAPREVDIREFEFDSGEAPKAATAAG